MAKPTLSDETTQSTIKLPTIDSKLVNLLALLLIRERQQVDQIDLLTRAGFRPVEIAPLIDTTPNNVSVRLAEMRRAKRESKGKGGKKGAK